MRRSHSYADSPRANRPARQARWLRGRTDSAGSFCFAAGKPWRRKRFALSRSPRIRCEASPGRRARPHVPGPASEQGRRRVQAAPPTSPSSTRASACGHKSRVEQHWGHEGTDQPFDEALDLALRQRAHEAVDGLTFLDNRRPPGSISRRADLRSAGCSSMFILTSPPLPPNRPPRNRFFQHRGPVACRARTKAPRNRPEPAAASTPPARRRETAPSSSRSARRSLPGLRQSSAAIS